jgi:hypothetical protein
VARLHQVIGRLPERAQLEAAAARQAQALADLAGERSALQARAERTGDMGKSVVGEHLGLTPLVGFTLGRVSNSFHMDRGIRLKLPCTVYGFGLSILDGAGSF